MVKRSGFSLIELILSVLVVAIVSVSLPLAIKTTSNLSEQALMQEGVMSAKTYMSLILKAPFAPQVLVAGSANPATHMEEAITYPLIICEPNGANPNFFNDSGIKGDGHRILAYPYQHSTSIPCSQKPANSTLPEATTSTNLAIKTIKSYYDGRTKTINSTTSDRKNRDFIVDIRMKSEVKEGTDKFIINAANPINQKDVNEIKITTSLFKHGSGNEEIKNVFYGYAFNVGESGTLGVKEWQ